jgi:hypothetical protein
MTVPPTRRPAPHRPLAFALASVLALGAASGAVRPAPAPEAARVAGQPGTAGRPAPAADDDSVVAFRLRDQFGRVHDAAAYRGRALILVGAGRGGRTAGTAWVEALRELQSDSAAPAVPVVAVADLRGVPRLLRRMVRGRFPDDPRRAVLLDWDGALARRLGVSAEECAVVLVGPTGRTHARTRAAAVDTARARALLRQAGELATAAAAPAR